MPRIEPGAARTSIDLNYFLFWNIQAELRAELFDVWSSQIYHHMKFLFSHGEILVFYNWSILKAEISLLDSIKIDTRLPF